VWNVLTQPTNNNNNNNNNNKQQQQQQQQQQSALTQLEIEPNQLCIKFIKKYK
jgi:hypothetical protein